MNNIIWKIKSFTDLNTKELYNILKIRQEVFIVEQTCYYLDADGFDDQAIHVWAEQDGVVVAYCRIFNERIKYPESSIGRVLTHPDYRQLKLGKKLMRIAISAIENRFHSTEIRISAQDYLLKFYTELGFITTAKKYLEDEIPHTEMYRSKSSISL